MENFIKISELDYRLAIAVLLDVATASGDVPIKHKLTTLLDKDISSKRLDGFHLNESWVDANLFDKNRSETVILEVDFLFEGENKKVTFLLFHTGRVLILIGTNHSALEPLFDQKIDTLNDGLEISVKNWLLGLDIIQKICQLLREKNDKRVFLRRKELMEKISLDNKAFVQYHFYG